MTIQEAANLQNDGAAGKACKNNTTHEHAHWQNAGTGAQKYLGEKNVKKKIDSIPPYSITSGWVAGGKGNDSSFFKFFQVFSSFFKFSQVFSSFLKFSQVSSNLPTCEWTIS